MEHLLYLLFIPKKKHEQVVEDNFGNSTVCILSAKLETMPTIPFPRILTKRYS